MPILFINPYRKMVLGFTGAVNKRFTSGIEKNVEPVLKPIKQMGKKIMLKYPNMIKYNSLIFLVVLSSLGGKMKDMTTKPIIIKVKIIEKISFAGFFNNSLKRFFNVVIVK